MNYLEFALTIGKLKSLKRTGWVRRNVPDPENVAAHSFRTAVLAMTLAPQVGADINKTMKMALIHDIGEAKIGDVVVASWDGKRLDMPKLVQKNVEETAAIHEIFALIDDTDSPALFEEFQKKKTLEAKLVTEVDKLDMAIQAYEYEKAYGIDLQAFFNNVTSILRIKEVKKIFNEVEAKRKHLTIQR